MHFKEKINLKKYFLLTSLSTLGTFYWCNGLKEILAVFAIYVTTVLNHILLVEGVILTFNHPPDFNLKKASAKILAVFMGKFFALCLGLSLGVHFMGHRVIIPLLNYVLQIFLLIYSAKRKVKDS